MDYESHRLVHSLTAHLSLYHSHISNPNPNPRASIIRWFSSLSPAHRQSILTISSSSFLLILLQMKSCIHRHGLSNFLLLPDLPSSSLPSLSFQPSHGLISRFASSNSSSILLSTSILLFSSTLSGATTPDSLTVSEHLATDVDRFVGVMDEISGGRFLRDEVDMMGINVEWVELPWLRDMGYYSLEAFVANRLEVALRLAWISSQGGKRLKEKRLKERATEVAGKAANAFWRMKGCLDWWVGLNFGVRKVIVSAFFGKAAKALVLF